MPLWTWLKDVIGVGALPSPPYSPAQLYSVVLASFKAWPFLIPVLSLINAPHGRFAFRQPAQHQRQPGLVPHGDPLAHLCAAWRSLPAALESHRQGHTRMAAASLGALLALDRAIPRAAVAEPGAGRALPGALHAPCGVAAAAVAEEVAAAHLGATVGDHPALASAATATLGAKAGGIASKFAASEIVRRLIVADAPDALGLGAPGLISPDVWKQPLWYLGLAGWAIGFAGNVYHDEILMDIRRPNNNAPKAQDSTSVGKGASARKYSIPRGGLFEYISFPNYLCECECPSRAGRRITKRRSLD
ncbi:hypothetical protein L1887_47609 [Cichorium endivia]|nr:hypothetical protein L1887_47609 [Cichorium endivia]